MHLTKRFTIGKVSKCAWYSSLRNAPPGYTYD